MAGVRGRVGAGLLVAFLLIAVTAAELPKNIRDMDEMALSQMPRTVFKNRDFIPVEEILFGVDLGRSRERDQECHIALDLEWTATVHGNVVDHPLVGDFRNDGSKEIAVGTVTEHVEVIEGRSGRKEPGWPFMLPDANFIASPIAYDLTGASQRDIVASTSGGEILFIRDDGFVYQGSTLKVPRLPVPRDWYKGMENSTVVYMELFRSLPDRATRVREVEQMIATHPQRLQEYLAAKQAHDQRLRSDVEAGMNERRQAFKQLVEHEQEMEDSRGRRRRPQGRRLQAYDFDDDMEDERGARFVAQGTQDNTGSSAFEGMQGWLTNDGVESFELFMPTEVSAPFIKTLRSGVNPLFSPQYEMFYEAMRRDGKLDMEGFVWVDAHITHEPVIADLDGDGHEELVASVQYSFRAHEYRGTKMFASMGPDFRSVYYAACGVVCFDLQLHQLKWVSPLELTTELGTYSASIPQSPLVVDLTGDGRLEIVVGTGLGSIFVLDSYGLIVDGFPIYMDSLRAAVVVEDVDEDGSLDIIAADSTSTVAVFDKKGKLTWEHQTVPGVSGVPIMGDVDGDGHLDIVLKSTSGIILALEGKTGTQLRNFPVRLESLGQGQAVLMRMNERRHMHVVVAGRDGHVYFVDGADGCVETLDMGKQSAGGNVVVDDVTGNGMMDVLVTADNVVACVSTDTAYHPSNVWRNPLHERNVPTSEYVQGVYFEEETRANTDVNGDTFYISFTIVDNRAPSARKNAVYNVDVTLRRDLDPLASVTFLTPGLKVLEVDAPDEQLTGVLRVQLQNEHRQYFFDEFALRFNTRFYRSLKWILVIPFAALSFVVFYYKEIVRGATQIL